MAKMIKKPTLMGAKHFLEMPKGTIYQNMWCDSKEELEKIIQEFKNGELLLYWYNLEMYYNNSYSFIFDDLCLDNEDEEGNFSLIDINVVGDADPLLTLYLVLDDETIKSLPNANIVLSKREEFLKMLAEENEEIDNTKDWNNDWAREELNEYSKSPNGQYVDFYCEEGGILLDGETDER